MARRISHLIRICAQQLDTDWPRFAVMVCSLVRFPRVPQLRRCAHHFADGESRTKAPGKAAIGLVTNTRHRRGNHPAL